MERFYKRTEIKLQCEVVTPMFLGGANQEAEWRAAPFKALLRSWWRVTQHGTENPEDLAAAEGRLFGRAGDENDSGKSLVRVFVRSEAERCTVPFPHQNDIKHIELKEQGQKVNPLTYLAGMGLLRPRKDKEPLLLHSYFPAGSKFQFSVDYPEVEKKTMRHILAFVQAFGGLGGRCRNGFGNFMITNPPLSPDEVAEELERFTVDWESQGMAKDYVTCLGQDEKGVLIWKTETLESWDSIMRCLAQAYVTIRTGAKDDGSERLDPGSKSNDLITERHLLGIPLTKHAVNNADRHASPLRFVIRKHPDGRHKGLVLHLPMLHSSNQSQLKDNQGNLLKELPRTKQIATWKKIHNCLDALLTRATYQEVLS